MNINRELACRATEGKHTKTGICNLLLTSECFETSFGHFDLLRLVRVVSGRFCLFHRLKNLLELFGIFDSKSMQISFTQLLACMIVDFDGLHAVESRSVGELMRVSEKVLDFVATLFLLALPLARMTVASLGALVVVLQLVLYTTKGVGSVLFFAQTFEAVQFLFLARDLFAL